MKNNQVTKITNLIFRRIIRRRAVTIKVRVLLTPRAFEAYNVFYRSFTEQLNHHEQRSMFDYLFKLPAEEQDRVIKKVRKLTGGLSVSGGELY